MAALERRRRIGEEMADIVAVDGKRVPIDEGVPGVDEGRHSVIIEEHSMASNHL